MSNVLIRKSDQVMMSLVHYFVTKENYAPINVQGVKDEIWLENLNGPYRIIRISCNSIINEEQFEFDIFKMKHVMKQIKKKTLSIKMNALNICLDISKKIDRGNVKDIETIKAISGVGNQNIKLIEELYNIKLELLLDGIMYNSDSKIIQDKLDKMFNIFLFMLENQYSISSRDIIYIKNLLDEDKADLCFSLYKKKEMLERNFLGKAIYPKTLKQREYINALESHDIVFGVGPAGTGKTYLAVVYAVSLLKKGIIKHLILTRPAVEAGESLGFLPGDLKEKIDPYLRPLYDALYDTLGLETTASYIERGIIEIAPLAYMRGRTLENAYAILDEAQNTTQMQMKMFLTRLGFNSKMVITGDISQIDLPQGKKSGLIEACYLFNDVKQISIVKFEKLDVVRHPLVQIIIDKYDSKEVK